MKLIYWVLACIWFSLGRVIFFSALLLIFIFMRIGLWYLPIITTECWLFRFGWTDIDFHIRATERITFFTIICWFGWTLYFVLSDQLSIELIVLAHALETFIDQFIRWINSISMLFRMWLINLELAYPERPLRPVDFFTLCALTMLWVCFGIRNAWEWVLLLLGDIHRSWMFLWIVEAFNTSRWTMLTSSYWLFLLIFFSYFCFLYCEWILNFLFFIVCETIYYIRIVSCTLVRIWSSSSHLREITLCHISDALIIQTWIDQYLTFLAAFNNCFLSDIEFGTTRWFIEHFEIYLWAVLLQMTHQVTIYCFHGFKLTRLSRLRCWEVLVSSWDVSCFWFWILMEEWCRLSVEGFISHRWVRLHVLLLGGSLVLSDLYAWFYIIGTLYLIQRISSFAALEGHFVIWRWLCRILLLDLHAAVLVLHQVVVFHHAEGEDEIPDLAHFVVDVVEIHILFKMISWYFVGEVSGYPRMLQCLIYCISQTWFWMTKFFNETLRELVEPSTVFQPFIVQSLGSICFICVIFLPKWMLASYHLVHDKACCPDVDRLTVALTTRHLLRRLVHQRSAGFVHALSCLIFYGETKINQFAAFQLISIGNDDIAWLQIPVNIIIAMQMLQPKQYSFDDFGAILILHMFPRVCICLLQIHQRPTLGVFHTHYHIIGICCYLYGPKHS